MNVAFFGTGILGFPMAQKVLAAGHKLWVYNRTPKKAYPLKRKGVVVCTTVSQAIGSAQVIILVLSDAEAIDEVLFKNKAVSLKGKTVIQMGTIGSTQSRSLQKKVKKLKSDYLECPVLGSRQEAQNASLILMVGGTREQFGQWADFLKCFGPHPRLIGPIGHAATLKLALNHLIASHAACFSLSLGLVRKNGIDVDQFMSILSNSALFAPMYAKKLPNWLGHHYENPNFPLKHLLKDVELILVEAKDKRIETKVLSSIRDVLRTSIKKGLAQKDYSAVYETINKK